MKGKDDVQPALGQSRRRSPRRSSIDAGSADQAEKPGTNVDQWFRSSDDVRTSFVSGNSFDLRPVTYSVVDGIAIFEGDIALGSAEEIERIAQSIDDPESLPLSGIAVVGDRFRWPDGIVPYEIAPALPRPERVTEAIQHWESRTPIRFVPLDTGNPVHANYVVFEQHDGCWSEVGMRGGRQVVSIGLNCGVGQAIHEIGHVVGLWHEHSRHDRDNHVEIIWENIQEGREHNFTQRITDGDDIGEYDVASIMHYPALAFSRNGLPTIIPRSGGQIGQRVGLSDLDVAAVKSMYSGTPERPSPAQPAFRAERSGTRSLGSIPPMDTRRWMTSDWPIDAMVIWAIVPAPVGARIEWHVISERMEENRLKYYLQVRNLSDLTIDVEVRYSIL